MFSEEIEKRPVRQSGLAITRHAGRRMQQRGLREPDVQLVRACGTAGPYGRTVLLDRDIDREIRECKQRIQSLERLRGCVVVSEDGVVVTAVLSHDKGQIAGSPDAVSNAPSAPLTLRKVRDMRLSRLIRV